MFSPQPADGADHHEITIPTLRFWRRARTVKLIKLLEMSGLSYGQEEVDGEGPAESRGAHDHRHRRLERNRLVAARELCAHGAR